MFLSPRLAPAAATPAPAPAAASGLTVTALALALAALLTGCGKSADGGAAAAGASAPASGAVPGAAAAAAAASAPPVSISTVRAQQKDLPVLITATGTVAPLSSVDVRPQTTSLITQVHVSEGQFVKSGQLLFTLDPRADEANVARARAQLAKDEAALADAQRQLKRSQELLAQNFISQGALDTNQTNVQTQLAAVTSSKAALDTARLGLSYTRVTAPGSGRLGAINVFAGSSVQANQTTLVSLTQLDPISVAFSLPQRHLADALAALKDGGAAVSATPPDNTATGVGGQSQQLPAPPSSGAPGGGGSAGAGSGGGAGPAAGGAGAAGGSGGGAGAGGTAGAGAGAGGAGGGGGAGGAPRPAGPPAPPPLQGRLKFVDNAVDPASGTVKVKAVFDNAAGKLWPGAFVNVAMTASTIKGAVVIPQAAIIQSARGTLVYTVQDGKAAPRPVQVLYAQGDDAAVSGLKPGERIVLDGRQNVRPGANVVERDRGGAGGNRGAGAASGAASGAKPTGQGSQTPAANKGAPAP